MYIWLYALWSGLGCAVCDSFLFPIFWHLVSKQYRRLTNNQKIEWNNRCVSSVHAVISSTLCAYGLVTDMNLWKDNIWAQNDLMRITNAISYGYMVQDLLKILAHYKLMGDSVTLLHHTVALIAFYPIVNLHVFTFYGCYRLFSEISTPFVNMRWHLHTLGLNKTRLYMAIGILMTVSFIVGRIVPILPFWYAFIPLITNSTVVDKLSSQGILVQYLVAASCCVALDLANIFWLRKMIHGLAKYLRHSSE